MSEKRVPRQLARTGNVAVAIVAMLAILVIVNYLGHKYHARWDWTSSSFYSLSDKTCQVLDSLDEDVRLISFLSNYGQPGADAVGEVLSLLEVFHARAPGHLVVETLDPIRDPLKAEQLLVEFDIVPRRGDPVDVIIVESGSRRRQVLLEELVQLEPGAGMGVSPRASALTAEGPLASAILAVTRGSKPVISFATGHGESQFEQTQENGLSRLAQALERDGLDLRQWDALGSTAVPAGNNLVIVAGPTQSWLEEETGALTSFLEEGGRVLLLIDPVGQRGSPDSLVPTGLDFLLDGWGLALADDVILDPSRALRFTGAETFAAQQVSQHPITRRMAGEPVLCQLARSVQLKGEREGLSTTVLLETSIDGWGETNLGNVSNPAPEDGDNFGPLAVGVIVQNKKTGARLAVLGDSDLLADHLLDRTTNRAFVLNLVSFMLDEERAMGIPPKDRKLSRLFLTPEQNTSLGLMASLGIPLLAVGLGLLTWWRRRSHR